MSDLLVTHLREHPARDSFFDLARRIFGLNFPLWHEQGYWTDRYMPYTLVRNGRAIANASANIIDTCVSGVSKRYIQIGTVMCDPDFRGQGLARRVMDALMNDWRDRCDAMYLYANDSVLDFYPKFGFIPAQEHMHSSEITPCYGDFMPLDMDKRENVDLFRTLYAQGNPYSAMPMLRNFGLVMFYCGSFMKENVYYSSSQRAACIIEQEGEVLLLHDVFGTPRISLIELAAQLAGPGMKRVILGFTPQDAFHFDSAPLIEEDTTLFILDGKENPFIREPLRMPFLSHA